MEEKKAATRLLIPALLAVTVVSVSVALVAVLGGGAEKPDADNSNPPLIGYAQGVTVVDDESSLQDAVDQMVEDASKEIIVSYKPQAISEDGTNFACYIANSGYNEYDMFIALYTDLGNEDDPLYLSGLIRPGEALRELTLDKPLDKGTHSVYLALTQVEDDHATIHGQSVLTLQMQVK